MYILYNTEFTLGYYHLVKDLLLKFKALKRLKEFKRKLKSRKTENTYTLTA